MISKLQLRRRTRTLTVKSLQHYYFFERDAESYSWICWIPLNWSFCLCLVFCRRSVSSEHSGPSGGGLHLTDPGCCCWWIRSIFSETQAAETKCKWEGNKTSRCFLLCESNQTLLIINLLFNCFSSCRMMTSSQTNYLHHRRLPAGLVWSWCSWAWERCSLPSLGSFSSVRGFKPTTPPATSGRDPHDGFTVPSERGCKSDFRPCLLRTEAVGKIQISPTYFESSV